MRQNGLKDWHYSSGMVLRAGTVHWLLAAVFVVVWGSIPQNLTATEQRVLSADAAVGLMPGERSTLPRADARELARLTGTETRHIKIKLKIHHPGGGQPIGLIPGEIPIPCANGIPLSPATHSTAPISTPAAAFYARGPPGLAG